jgi:hypothetical protein
MLTVIRCPRAGRACSEVTCQERHWCRNARPLAERAAFEAQIPRMLDFQVPSNTP